LNSRLDELHAAVLHDALLPHLDEWTRRRAAWAERYVAGLSHPFVRVVAPGSASVWHLFPIRVGGGHRDALVAFLRGSGVQASVHYPTPIPYQPALRQMTGLQVHGELPRARSLAMEEVSLPIHPLLEADEIDRVIELVNRWRP
jgi:dTDP-4-amino-4,6-dideoxygalactose transaminase